jgi:membrane fusion protein, multidrug efflux system
MAKAKLRSAQAAVAQAEARRNQAAATVAQAGQSASASHAQIATTEATVRQAQAGLASSEVSPAQVGVRRSEAKGATANVAAARARLEQARLNLSYTRIVAPVDGTVAQKNVEVGQYVQPGQSLVAVVPTQGTYVLANYKETQLERVRVGQPARFTVDAYPGTTFTGSVESISPGTGSVFSLLPPENASGNFTKVVQRVPVRIRITSAANPQTPLRAGMSAVATVEVGGN